MAKKPGTPTKANLATGKTERGKPAPKSAKQNPFGGKKTPKKSSSDEGYME